MKVPILRLDRILLVSMPADLTDADAMQLQGEVLQKIAEIEAVGLALDITALEIVDSFMARVINDTAGMARMLGSEVVVCGVQPYVAMTIVEMGRDAINGACTFNLDQGLRMLRARIADRGDVALEEPSDGLSPD